MLGSKQTFHEAGQTIINFNSLLLLLQWSGVDINFQVDGKLYWIGLDYKQVLTYLLAVLSPWLHLLVLVQMR